MGSVFKIFNIFLLISMFLVTSNAQVESSTSANNETTPIEKIQETTQVQITTTEQPVIEKKDDGNSTPTPTSSALTEEVPLTEEEVPSLVQELPSSEIKPFHTIHPMMAHNIPTVHYPHYPIHYYNPISMQPTYVYEQRPVYFPAQLYPQRPLYYPFPTYHYNNLQPHQTQFYPNTIVQNHKTGGAAYTHFYPSPPDNYRNQFSLQYYG